MIRDTAHASRADASSVGRARVRWRSMNGSWAWTPIASSSSVRRSPGTVRIVTDSASDILPSHARALGVLVIPNRIVLDGWVLREGFDITAAQYYAHLAHARSAPFTEPAPPADFYNAYVAILRAGAPAIVSIHTSSRLSQVVRHAVAARDYLAPATIDVIDSLQLGIGMWPAVIEASRLANLGAAARDVHQRVVALLARTHAFVLVESFEALRRSGRIGRVQGRVGTPIGWQPVLTLDQGKARLGETVRSRRRALLRLCDLAQELAAIE